MSKYSHSHTILPFLLTKLFIKVGYDKKQRVTTSDGDFFDLEWVNFNIKNAPTIILFPGMEGGTKSHYATRIMHHLKNINWRGCVFHARGCSGVLNNTLSFYHGGFTDDIKECIATVRRESNAPIFAIGVSLGGNALIKLLANDSDTSDALSAVATLSVPFDLDITSNLIDAGINRFLYMPYLLNPILRKMKQYSLRYPQLNYNDKVNTVHGFNDHYITQVYGFNSAKDYYAQSSSKNCINSVKVPMLVIQAKNDPIIPVVTHPNIKNKNIKFYTLDFGGHAGFAKISFKTKHSLLWLPKFITDYFESIIRKQHN